MNSLHSGLQNKDTYYLNQFYLRISYSDKSYKKHPNTKLQQTAFLWVSYRQWDFHPEEAHWAHQWSLLQELLQSTPQAQCSQHKPHHLQVTLPHLQIINRKKTTHHTAFTAVDIREKKYKYSFHRTHSTSWLTRYRTLLRVFHMWMSFECNKHSYFICYHCSPHTLSPKPQDGETSRKENKTPLMHHQVSACALSCTSHIPALSCLGTTTNPTQGFKSSDSLLVPSHSLAFTALIRLHEIKSSG